MDDFGESILGIIFLVLIWWGISSLWHYFTASNTNDYQTETHTSSPEARRICPEPENPYSYNTGHYTGWEWGENGNSCYGESNSFIEGCEEYEAAESDYEFCLNQ
jgi:hypothetical protein